MITKPMLAAAIAAKDVASLPYPMLATPKFDGIRCLIVGQEALSRKFKLIPNRFVREQLKGLPDNLDGELIVGKTFQDCSSGIMSHGGDPDFTYWVFDYVKESLERYYSDRLMDLAYCVDELKHPRVQFVPVKVIKSEEDLNVYEASVLANGFEGVILRTMHSPYKCGRSTVSQRWLLKIKRFTDAEAEIIGFEEMMHNENELEQDDLGYAKRSSAKGGKVPAGTLGKFLVKDPETGIKFAVGTGRGLTYELRQQIWDTRASYLGQLIKYKFQPHGVKEAPRTPIWLGFRHQDDS
jgi:DNA ligase-1